MAIGFRADDSEDEETLSVLDGTASEGELTLQQQVDVFIDMSKRLLGMGAVEVRSGSFRVVFAQRTRRD